MISFWTKSLFINVSRNKSNMNCFRQLGTVFDRQSKCVLSLNGKTEYFLRMFSIRSSQQDPQINSVTNTSNGNIVSLPLKKRPLRKKKHISNDEAVSLPGFCNIKAMATAEEYDLEGLLEGLILQNSYTFKTINASGKSIPDVIHAVPKYEEDHETKEVYFFREGTVVMWNMPEFETVNIIKLLKNYEENSYTPSLIHDESEIMSYTYAEPGRQTHLKDGDIHLAINESSWDKYTVSNALSQSVKLGIWEALLDRYANSMESITDDLKAGRKIRMSREQVLQKQGELFALRHAINLSSDLLDTPDFYWEKEELERLYQQTCSYFNITKRTRVMNEKINHCVELVELVSSHLSDRHHIRLEWMIIILIIAEVVFEIIHFVDRNLNES